MNQAGTRVRECPPTKVILCMGVYVGSCFERGCHHRVQWTLNEWIIGLTHIAHISLLFRISLLTFIHGIFRNTVYFQNLWVHFLRRGDCSSMSHVRDPPLSAWHGDFFTWSRFHSTAHGADPQATFCLSASGCAHGNLSSSHPCPFPWLCVLSFRWESKCPFYGETISTPKVTLW